MIGSRICEGCSGEWWMVLTAFWCGGAQPGFTGVGVYIEAWKIAARYINAYSMTAFENVRSR